MPITKFFRVAQSGPTIDGREISPAQIDEMAASYNPKTYGARVNLEHFMSMYPDSVFKAYGDVLALKAEDGPNGGRTLLAQIDAFPDLVKLKKDGQKVYWSIEIAPNFASTGKAYLVGLAATDTPASLGTEMLTFAAVKAPDKVKANLYSAAFESDFEVDEVKPEGPGLLAKVKDLLSSKVKGDESRFAQVEGAVTAIAEEVAAVKKDSATFATADAVKTVSAALDKVQAQLTELTTKLSHTPDSPPRPQHSGAPAPQTTDC